MRKKKTKTEELPDAPCYQQQATYKMCQKCYYLKTCVMPIGSDGQPIQKKRKVH